MIIIYIYYISEKSKSCHFFYELPPHTFKKRHHLLQCHSQTCQCCCVSSSSQWPQQSKTSSCWELMPHVMHYSYNLAFTSKQGDLFLTLFIIYSFTYLICKNSHKREDFKNCDVHALDRPHIHDILFPDPYIRFAHISILFPDLKKAFQIPKLSKLHGPCRLYYNGSCFL